MRLHHPVALSRRPLHGSTHCQRKQAPSASHMFLWLSRIWMNAPQCCRSMASALSTSFLVCRCWKACVPLKVVIRSFRLCCSSTATHLLSSGRTMRARHTRSVREEGESRAIPQHLTLCAIQSKLHGGEHLPAFLEDVYAVSPPAHDLWAQSRIQIHASKTQI